jgi:hypothetical protein
VHQLAISYNVDQGEVLADPLHESNMPFTCIFRSAAGGAEGKHVPQDLLEGVALTASDHLANLHLLLAVPSKVIFVVKLLERNFWHS